MSERRYTRASLRERLIQKLNQPTDRPFFFERTVLHWFSAKQRAAVVAQLSSLLSDGYVHRLGTGKQSDPFRIVRSKAWPFEVCPLCGHVKQIEVSPGVFAPWKGQPEKEGGNDVQK